MQIRKIDYDRDAPGVCRIMAEFDSEPLTPADLLRRWRDNDQAIDPLRLVAEESGQIVAYANIRRWSFLNDGMAIVDIGVAEAYKRKGLGSRLAEMAFDHARQSSWSTFITRGREESDEGPEKFWKTLGFEEHYRMFESVMDVEGVDARLGEIYFKAIENGFTFKTWAEYEPTDEMKERFWHLQTDLDRDEPAAEDMGLFDYPAFCMEVLDSPRFLPEATFFAEKNGEWAGFHSLELNRNGDTDGNVGFTGVCRAFRGQGLSKALKWAGVLKAREYGWKTVLTHNDTRNAPMLAVNEQFGFVRRPGWVHFKKDLSA